MSVELEERIQWFREEYLDTPAGQKHLAVTEAEPKEVKKIFEEVREKYVAGQDITDDVLRRLLPHIDSEFHRQNNYRISTWPCIQKDVRSWFEGAGWKKPEDWEPTARLIFEAIDGLINGQQKDWDRFLDSEYRHGFGTGFISPILFCLDERFPVINSKVVKTYGYCTEQLGELDEIDAKLVNYLKNAAKVRALLERLAPLGLKSIREFDIFCHYMVSKRLGGGDLTKVAEPKYAAWLFVANPEIFEWDQAFVENGVDWTGSKGTYAQKLIRQQLHPGDRVFGYQAGPDYELCCELRIASKSYKTPDGTWAVDLSPVSRFERPIPLSVLKSHPVLSNLKFIQQTQMSISGITAEQLAELDQLISKPAIQTEISLIDRFCKDLRAAQFDTSSPDKYESLLADAFTLLGFEAEHLGGAGKPDVVVTGSLGSDTYTVVIEAKTCKGDSVVGLAQVNYASITDHKEEYAADYSVLIGPGFSGGKLIQHAINHKVGLITTEALIVILKQHYLFPFSLIELRRLFEPIGFAEAIEDELGRVHSQHYNYLQLTSTVLQILDDLQRLRDSSEPISSVAIYYLLLGRAQQEQVAPPDRKQIDQVLALLSNPVLDILSEEEDGYILTMSLEAAQRRLAALESLISGEP
jgi:predicted RNA-binding protein with PUA-like domain